MRLVEPKRTVRVDHPRTVHELEHDQTELDETTAAGQPEVALDDRPAGNGRDRGGQPDPIGQTADDADERG